MPTITVPEETYERLMHRAAAMKTTVDAIVASAIEQIARDPQPAKGLTFIKLPNAEWEKNFDEMLAQARSRADRYPPGFEVDISREAMYPDDLA